MELRDWVITAIASILLVGCVDIPVVHPTTPPPSQSPTAKPPAGHARAVFFNTSNWLLYVPDGTDRINIYLDGAPLGSLRRHDFLQVFVNHGRHVLGLHHKVIVVFEDEYDIEISGEEAFIVVWCRPFSTQYELVDSLSPDFEATFSPVH